jgi:anti-sigma B factor antagonist
MPQTSVLISPSAASRHAACPSFLCTWRAGGSQAAWVHVAGELDLASSSRLRQTLREAQLDARLVVLDLRDLTFIDSSGIHVILDAAHAATREGRRLMLVHGPPEVHRVLELTGVSAHLSILDLHPAEPTPALHLV